jgi:hypothetical protein
MHPCRRAVRQQSRDIQTPVPAAVRSLISPGRARPHSSARSYPSPAQAIHPPTHRSHPHTHPPSSTVRIAKRYPHVNRTPSSEAGPLKRSFRSFNYPVSPSARPLSTTARRTSRHVAPSRKQTTHHHTLTLTPPRRQRPLLSKYLPLRIRRTPARPRPR